MGNTDCFHPILLNCFLRATAYMHYSVYAIACPSVCLSVRWVDHRKTVEVRMMKFSPYGAPYL